MDMESELPEGSWRKHSFGDNETEAVEEYGEICDVSKPGMHFSAAFLFGAWYSIVFSCAMSFGVKSLNPESPDAHWILQSVAWALGAGFAIALASNVSQTYRLLVGVGSTLVSVAFWIALVFFLRGYFHPPDQLIGGLAALILIVGLAGSYLGASLPRGEGLAGLLLLVHPRHFLWLWVALWFWVSVLPMVGYYFWLQVSTGLFSLIHPSLWFSDAFDLALGYAGIFALLKGVEIALRSLINRTSYGGTVWKRTLMFLFAFFVLTSYVAPKLLDADIGGLKKVPTEFGVRPWWVL